MATTRSGDPPTTIRLVKSARDGDREALEKLFLRYLPRVRRIVALRMGRRLRAFWELDDLVQEALMKVFRGLDTFREDRNPNFQNWVATCVKNDIVDHVKHLDTKKRGGGLPFPGAPTAPPLSAIIHPNAKSPSWHLRNRELEERVETAILELPEDYREVIILRFLCECDYAVIARLMNFEREASARMAVSRAIQKLRERLGHPS